MIRSPIARTVPVTESERPPRAALNRKLAELLGWTDIQAAGFSLMGTPPWWAGNSRGQAMVPDWEGSWAACGPLMVRHGCYPSDDWDDTASIHVEYASFPGGEKYSGVDVDVRDYGSKDEAARAAVVLAAIAQMECAGGEVWRRQLAAAAR